MSLASRDSVLGALTAMCPGAETAISHWDRGPEPPLIVRLARIGRTHGAVRLSGRGHRPGLATS